MYGFAPHVSVASRRAQAERRLAQLRKQGQPVAPIVIDGRKIATTFWGESWCDNLERYSDFANRLPRGRSYVRNGAVVDLQMTAGLVTALVSGSDLYEVRVTVTALPVSRWRDVCHDVSGAIDSVIELLQGRLSDRVMARLCADGTGLFPSPREIEFSCSCPDGAYMCKHVAAVLYGVGARLDREPGLIFTLRHVQEADLVGGSGARAAAALVTGRRGSPGSQRITDDASLSDVFGIDVVGPPAEPAGGLSPASRPGPPADAGPRRRRKVPAPKGKKPAPAKAERSAAPAGTGKKGRTGAERRQLSEQLRRTWAARVKATRKK